MTGWQPRIVALAIAALLAPGCSVLERTLVHPPRSGVDLNQASPAEIARLPGLAEEDAARIVENRPYTEVEEVVRRGIVSPKQFAKFADRVYVSRPSARAPTVVVPTMGD